jgi:hypothetical protein
MFGSRRTSSSSTAPTSRTVSAANFEGPSGNHRDHPEPKEAKAVAQDLVDRGLIPNLDSYAKNYFAAQAKGK